MKKKVITLGEIMLRLTPPNFNRFSQAEHFIANYGGAEANIAVLLGQLGVESCFVSQVPNNAIGQCAIDYLRKYNVNTDYTVKKGERLGLYYFEKGNSIRPSKVVYDRANSSITKADIDDFDFQSIFKDADWFHFSGITAALGENCIYLVKKAIAEAKKNKVKISVDLNYRKQLWSYKEFEAVMADLIKDVDLCIGWLNCVQEEDSTEYKVADFSNENFDENYFVKLFCKMRDTFNIKYVATTLRENHSATNNSLSAIIYDGENLHKSNKYTFNIIDRVGAGDSFAGGLIYKLVNESNVKEALDFGIASAVLKHTVEGDANIVSEEEILDIVFGNISGSVKR